MELYQCTRLEKPTFPQDEKKEISIDEDHIPSNCPLPPVKNANEPTIPRSKNHQTSFNGEN